LFEHGWACVLHVPVRHLVPRQSSPEQQSLSTVQLASTPAQIQQIRPVTVPPVHPRSAQHWALEEHEPYMSAHGSMQVLAGPHRLLQQAAEELQPSPASLHAGGPTPTGSAPPPQRVSATRSTKTMAERKRGAIRCVIVRARIDER